MNNKTFLLFLFLIISFYYTKCQQSSQVNSISAEEFLTLSNYHNITILDVRTASEYQSGHLENAVLIDIHSSDFSEKIERLDREKNYYVYCRSGRRSGMAARQMTLKGFPNVYNINGGIIQLKRNGAKLEK